MRNNIFEYATGELSQDAFICWCVNWFHDDSKPRLQEMSIELISLFSGAEKIKSVNICRQFSQDVYIDGKKYALKIDVLIIVNESVAVIVEDKTYTSEHDDQMQRYVDGIRHLAVNAKENEKFYGIEDIRTVFLKTGFMYDEDKCVKSDVVVSGEDFLKMLLKYVGNSEILDSYIAYLENSLQWYVDFGNYEGNADPFWKWNIANHQIAQYRLMRDIFPELMWMDRDDWEYKVYHGTSFGRPWTEMRIGKRYYADSADYFSVFWRIDTDDEGPYISLRFYEDFDKKDAVKKERHKNLYEAMSSTMKDIIDVDSDYVWNDIYPGYRGNYKESSLIHIKLKDKLMNWSESKAGLIAELNKITRIFCGQLDNLVRGENV